MCSGTTTYTTPWRLTAWAVAICVATQVGVAASGVATHIHGKVHLPNGSPGAGAVVVSGAGGQAIGGPDGAFLLEVSLPAGAASIGLSAVATVAGVTYSGDITVAVPPKGHDIEAGDINMDSQTGCQAKWLPTFGPTTACGDWPRCVCVFDDGSGGGPALFVGGNFTTIGSLTTKGIARWNGHYWSPVGGGLAGNGAAINAMIVYNDGSGPALYAGGGFTSVGGVTASSIARWNGTTWSAVGSGIGGTVNALAAVDAGSPGGPVLYAGGNISNIGATSVKNIVRWNGVNWAQVGAGLNDTVQTLQYCSIGNGGTPSLYAGGYFTASGGPTVYHVGRWTGSAWVTVGDGVDGTVHTICSYDSGNGSGPQLYVGGNFSNASSTPAKFIAKWSGSSWSSVGSGANNIVSMLRVYDDGSGAGPRLYIGGGFTNIGGLNANHFVTWNGTSFATVGGGFDSDPAGLAGFDDGTGGGLALHAVGGFVSAGGIPVGHMAKFRDGLWSSIGPGLNGAVTALTARNAGQEWGPALYAGGEFTTANGTLAPHVAKWDGANWSPLSTGTDKTVYSMTIADVGDLNQPALYVGGIFYSAGGVPAVSIAKWNGTAWSAVGAGLSGSSGSAASVNALVGWKSPVTGTTALYAGGVFSQSGGAPISHVAMWNGSTWTGISAGMCCTPNALCVHDDGTGSALYVGGDVNFSNTPMHAVIRWNGTAWSPVGNAPYGTVYALAVWDDGSGGGPALYAAGDITNLNGQTLGRIAKWNGTTWSALGSGLNDTVYALAVYDDGSGGGSALYAGGEFTLAGGVTVGQIAKWNGSAWSAVSPGFFDYALTSLARFDDGHGAGLCAGGAWSVTPAADGYLARWGGCTADCNDDGIADWIQIQNGSLPDANGNGIPDCCEVSGHGSCLDLNGDGKVDGADLAIVIGLWGTNPGTSADTNGDGIVNGLDLCTILAAWGPCQ